MADGRSPEQTGDVLDDPIWCHGADGERVGYFGIRRNRHTAGSVVAFVPTNASGDNRGRSEKNALGLKGSREFKRRMFQCLVANVQALREIFSREGPPDDDETGKNAIWCKNREGRRIGYFALRWNRLKEGWVVCFIPTNASGENRGESHKNALGLKGAHQVKRAFFENVVANEDALERLFGRLEQTESSQGRPGDRKHEEECRADLGAPHGSEDLLDVLASLGE